MIRMEKEEFYKDALSKLNEFNRTNNFGPGLDE